MHINRNKKEFDKVFPLLGVQDGYIISKRGDITLGWDLELPVAYNLLDEEYDSILASWASAVKVLPPWYIVHRQDSFIYDKYKPRAAEGFLEDAYERHFEGRDYPVHYARVFLTLSSKAHVTSPNKSSGLFQNLTFTPPKIKRNVVQDFRNKAEEFIQIVTRNGLIKATLLTTEDYLGTVENPGIIQRYMMLGSRSPLVSDIEMHPDSVHVLEKHMSSFSINEVDLLPSEVGNVDKVDALSGVNSPVYLSAGAKLGVLLDCNHIVNSYVVSLPQEATIRNLDNKRKRMESGSERGADNRVGAAEINEFIEDVQTESRIIVQTHMNVLVFSDKESHNNMKAKVSTALASMGIVASLNIFDTPVLYYSGIPGAAAELGSDNLMTMELGAALCLGCNETFEREIEGGNYRTVDSLRCIPISIDLQRKARDAGYIDNYNAFVLGGSGTGKSFFTNHYLRNCYDRGESVFIIDVGDSYEGSTQIIYEQSHGKDGLYYSWDSEHPLSFNPFIGYDSWLDGRGELNQDESGVNVFLSSLFAMWRPDGGWNSDRKRILTRIVTAFVVDDMKTRKNLKISKAPVFDDFCKYVDKHVTKKIREGKYDVDGVDVTMARFDIDSFLLAIGPYRSTGEFGFLLNDPSPKDLFSNRWTVFEVDKLSQVNNDIFYSLVILWIMNSFDMKMRRNPEFKILVIEEAWKAIANESFSGYIGGLYKTARKFFTSVMTVTQQLSDIMRSSVIQDTILKNSSIRILLDQSSNQNNFDDVQSLLGMTDIDRNLCLSVNRALNPKYRYKQVFISWGAKKRGVYNTEVSLEEALSYESEKVKKRPVLEKAQELGSIIEAVKLSAAVIRAAKR